MFTTQIKHNNYCHEVIVVAIVGNYSQRLFSKTFEELRTSLAESGLHVGVKYFSEVN